MKGIMFTELLGMVEKLHGEAMVDAVLDRLRLSTGGAYTSVGHYPVHELMTLIDAFAAAAGMPSEALQRAFGAWIVARFTLLYPAVFQPGACPLDTLERIEAEVHIEIEKLWPASALPSVLTERIEDHRMRLTYTSPRPLVEFWRGIIDAVIAAAGDTAEVTLDDRSVPGRSDAVFTIRLRDR